MSQPKKKAFLAAYATMGTVTGAARKVGIDRRTHSRWLKNPAYRRAFLAAEDEAIEYLEQEARRRALTGAKPSDTLLIFLLKAKRPNIYRERHEITGTKGKAIETPMIVLSASPDEVK